MSRPLGAAPVDPVALAVPNAQGSGAGRGGACGVQTLPLRESPGFSSIQSPLPRPPRGSIAQPSVLVLRGNGSVCSCRFGIGESESRTLLGPQPDREPHGSYQPDCIDQQSEAQRNSRFCPRVSHSDRDSWGPGVPGSCRPAPPEGARAPAASMPSSAHLHRGANRTHGPGGSHTDSGSWTYATPWGSPCWLVGMEGCLLSGGLSKSAGRREGFPTLRTAFSLNCLLRALSSELSHWVLGLQHMRFRGPGPVQSRVTDT